MGVAASNPVLKHAIVGGLATLGAGFMSFPVSALISDNAALPLGLGMSTAAGAGIAAALPGMAGRHATRGKAALLGLGYGALASAAGIGAWAMLLGDR